MREGETFSPNHGFKRRGNAIPENPAQTNNFRARDGGTGNGSCRASKEDTSF